MILPIWTLPAVVVEDPWRGRVLLRQRVLLVRNGSVVERQPFTQAWVLDADKVAI